MHDAAFAYVAATVNRHQLGGNVLDVGGRNINGTCRHLFNDGCYVVVDIADGSDVDVVADAATLDLPVRFDVVVCTEVLEHTDQASAIVATAYRHLVAGGVFVATMAGTGRAPHSAVDGGPLRPDEFYRNVTADDLTGWLTDAGFDATDIDDIGDDIRCTAWRLTDGPDV